MNASSAPQDFSIVETESHLVSLNSFYAILWVGFTICTSICAGRIYVRCMCFRRLLPDDCLMLFALALLLSIVCLGQAYLRNIYTLVGVENGQEMPGPTFPDVIQQGLRAFGIMTVLAYLGIWTIKLNFLLFFRRFGSKLTSFNIFWWVVLFVVVACGAIGFGVIQYHCLFGPVDDIMTVCAEHSVLSQTYTDFKVTCIVDVVSDVLIICFPIVILWKVRINLKQKLILFGIFSLVIFTIAVTVVRASIFGGVYRSIDESKKQELNIEWIWFWFFIEFSVSFVIASLTSFRALFTRRDSQAQKNRAQLREQAYQARKKQSSQKKIGIRQRARLFHDSLLESFRATETLDMDLPIPASGRFSPSFVMDIEGNYTNKGITASTYVSSS